MGLLMGKIRPFSMELLPFLPLKNGFWPVILLLFMISEWNFTDMLNSKGYILQRRTVTLSSSWVIRPWLIWKMFLTCSSFTIWNIWMKLHRYVDHQRLHIVTKDIISLSISVLLLFRHYISHKITFGAPSSGGVLCSACGAFISVSQSIILIAVIYLIFYLQVLSADSLCKQFRPRSGPTMLGLIWIQTFLTLMVILRLYNINFEKYQQITKKHQNFPTCKELNSSCNVFRTIFLR